MLLHTPRHCYFWGFKLMKKMVGFDEGEEEAVETELMMEEAAGGGGGGGSSGSTPPPPPPPPPAHLLTDDLRAKILRQVEYYFSDDNLPTDSFLLNLVRKNKHGFVPIAVVASFRKMKKLIQDDSLIEAALRTSSHLVVSLDGKQVRRFHPLPVSNNPLLVSGRKKEKKLRTVLVKNLPEDQTVDDISRIFANIGNIKDISFLDLKGTETKKEKGPICRKMHVLIEYETIEAAKDAVTKLNDESNWRSSMHVELLLKNKEKQGLVLKGQKKSSSKAHSNFRASDSVCQSKLKSTDLHDEKLGLQEDLGIGSKILQNIQSKHHVGGHQANVRVRWYMESCNSDGSLKKPAPMPRMPDGTRGFTMGRGQPIIQHQL